VNMKLSQHFAPTGRKLAISSALSALVLSAFFIYTYFQSRDSYYGSLPICDSSMQSPGTPLCRLPSWPPDDVLLPIAIILALVAPYIIVCLFSLTTSRVGPKR
jgi:hypothetical protein